MDLKFSIIIPTYNRKQVIGRAIRSILEQSFSNWEMIVVDDSQESQQNEIDIIGDSRISYIFRGEKLGVGSARNMGAERSSGKYLIFLDDDDEVTKNYLSDFSKLIGAENEREPDVVYCGMKVFKDNRKPKNVLPSSFFKVNKESLGIVLAGAWTVRKDFFALSGGYDNRFLFSENMELFFRFRQMTPTVKFTDQLNLIRFASTDGASKNFVNIVNSNKLMLEKHADFFHKKKSVKILYLQVIGVNLLRLRNFKEARRYLKRAYFYNPWKVNALLRLIISHFPVLSKVIYA